jgi:hypothetical protein
MVSNSTQKTPTVVRLEKNMPIELIRKSSRYCILDLMYWASMRKYMRR